MSEPSGPVRGFWNAALMVLGGCLLLWLATAIIQSIWLWLLIGALLVSAIWALVVWWRWRQRRW